MRQGNKYRLYGVRTLRYKNFEKPLPILGIGTMRFPEKDVNGSRKIDTGTAIKMIRYAIDHGACYIDTARPYHNGESEKVVGMALKDGYRDRTYLVTKLTPWQIKTEKDMEIIFNEQLQNLQVQYVDIYLLHYLTRNNWIKFLGLNAFSFLEKMKRQGKIKHIGFSFHDDYEFFKEVLDYYDWDICQVQMNILDAGHQATIRGIKYAGKKGIPVVIMEPLKGGRLINNIPEEVTRIWDGAAKKRPVVEWAFKWLCNIPEVTVILSGVSDMEQLKQNLGVIENIQGEVMSAEELEVISNVVKAYKRRVMVECTACKYCMPCPHCVDIPAVFHFYNEACILKDCKQSLLEYWNLVMAKGGGANMCTQCGKCTQKCPQGLNIPVLMKKAHQYLMNQGNIVE